SQLTLQPPDHGEKVFRAVLQVGERRAEKGVDRFGRGPPAIRPAVDVGTHELSLPGDAELAQVAFDVICESAVALDEGGGAGPAAERLQAVDAGAGEDVEERPAGNRVAEDAEQRLADHLRGRPQSGVD